MKPAQVRAIFSAFEKHDPEPRTELTYTNPFTLLVAIVLSAQATDASVNLATPALFKAADTPSRMAALGGAKIKDFIKTIGLFNAKAKNVAALSQMLLKDFGGKVPETREELVMLPGVGRKTANVWLNCVLGLPTMAVDTHVLRVANRIGLAKAATPEETERQLMKAIPGEFMLHAHHWLILHGRYTCKARKPMCGNCIIRQWCGYKEKTA